jgi:aryl-alcohol dehydrogenase-like predicted oxidoreductase
MEIRTLGSLWPVSALTLGGGGLGQVWGATTREEAVATVREAVDAGITLLDLAPSYGAGEAESVIGAAFGGRLPAGVRVTTKCRVGDTPAAEVAGLLERSLDESLNRMRVDHADLFFLHNSLVPAGEAGGERKTPRGLFDGAVRPALERLAERGRIGGWGITAVGVPGTVLEVLAADPAPRAAQAIANLLDSPGEMRWFAEPPRPRDIIAAARARGTGVLGIRAVQAGALTDGIDRDLPDGHPARADFGRAAPVRDLARELGESTASLAHRYALSMPGVDTVVLGVKNRAELRDCLAAEARGPLPPEVRQEIETRLSRPAGALLLSLRANNGSSSGAEPPDGSRGGRRWGTSGSRRSPRPSGARRSGCRSPSTAPSWPGRSAASPWPTTSPPSASWGSPRT